MIEFGRDQHKEDRNCSEGQHNKVDECLSTFCTVSRWFLKKDAVPERRQGGADPEEVLNFCQHYLNRIRGFGFEPVCLCRRWMCPILLSRHESREDSSGEGNIRLFGCTREVILAPLAELGRPVNIAAFSLGPHY